MTFSGDAGDGQVKKEAVRAILKALAASPRARVPELGGKLLVDTARVYQSATPNADTETVLGEVLAEEPELRASVHIATKVHPRVLETPTLSKSAVIAQVEASLRKLQVSCIDLLYLHQPDIQTDIGDTIDGIAELAKAGMIKEFGLSNYPAWKVVDVYHRCKAKGCVLPTVYQGMYNGITRDFEREVVPVLREFNMRAMMYNPLAGGLLTGRYAAMEDITNAKEGRFSDEFDKAFGAAVSAKAGYVGRYSKAAVFEALAQIKQACDSHGVSMVSASIRWVLHHSYLSAAHGDGIIFGVSKPEQMEANLAACAEGPLPREVVEAMDAAWATAAPVCESYFRGYGAKPGDVAAHLALFGQKLSAL